MEKANKYGYMVVNEFLEVLNTYRQVNKEVNRQVSVHREALREISDLSRQMSDAIIEAQKALSVELMEIDWDENTKAWIESNKELGEKGWSFPLNMNPEEVVKFSKRKDIDTIMQDYFTRNNEQAYISMKSELLSHEFTTEWHGLLEQCFENYENENYSIAIPSLFVIVESIGNILIDKRFEKYYKGTDKPPKVSTKFKIVEKEVSTDGIYYGVYASVLELLTKLFKYGGFENNSTRPSIINRNWVLHGRDVPSNWQKADALRLFNVIYSYTALDFLLEKPKEQLTEA